MNTNNLLKGEIVSKWYDQLRIGSRKQERKQRLLPYIKSKSTFDTLSLLQGQLGKWSEHMSSKAEREFSTYFAFTLRVENKILIFAATGMVSSNGVVLIVDVNIASSIINADGCCFVLEILCIQSCIPINMVYELK